ncbi:hypothetical protein ARMSODRAFT_952860 [Armillaria solidipes]|uniref:Zn(2)-C6 fungal-type domain-containing protein n=1 Tax=Armillaria solidipes TaxID=1076256 RepID=A0A2H3BSH8_9AGAR|nr:hypothetical protein ARMSODRAFT_952860 [Armillaria solidipes]
MSTSDSRPENGNQPSRSVSADGSDDAQLTIRIPNPKVYMARQSLWVGRRGKLRCDACRAHNLKCDRVQPSCNQCTWVPGRECKYTPLPTPAHRGIPRCDTCRLNNLKCDRNVPVCDQCQMDNNPNCVYSPKRRSKTSTTETPVASTAPKANAEKDSPPLVPSSSAPSSSIHAESSSRASASRTDVAPQQRSQHSTPSVFYHSPSSVSFLKKDMPAMIKNRVPLQPWSHPTILPLPRTILQGLMKVDPEQMPVKIRFEEALDNFLNGLIPNLRDTAPMSPEMYSAVANYLAGKGVTRFATHIREWLAHHHVRSGSNKYSILLIPRDIVFQSVDWDEDTLLRQYRNHTDGTGTAPLPSIDADAGPDKGDGAVDWRNAFERVPVRSQMWDILTYTHRNHSASYDMLRELRGLYFANITWPMVDMFNSLCPHCAGKNKTASSIQAKGESERQSETG